MGRLWGHESVRRALGQALSQGRLPHALLFHGPAGVGKRTLASTLGQFLLCQHPRGSEEEWTPCEECSSCRWVRAGTHPDFHLLQPQRSQRTGPSGVVRQEVISIESVRAVAEGAQYSPVVSSCQVFLIVRADTMTAEAANALLKTLEEPPPGTYLFLTATNRAALLPTVLSRCVSMPMGLCPRGTVEAFLQEEKGLSPQEAAWIAALAGGRIGEAARLAEEPRLRQWRQQAVELLCRLKSGPPVMALTLAERAAGSGEEGIAEADGMEVPRLLDLLQSLYRDALMRCWGWPSLWPPEEGRWEEWAGGLAPEALLRGWKDLEQAQRLLRRNANAQLVLEQLFLRLHEGMGAG